MGKHKNDKKDVVFIEVDDIATMKDGLLMTLEELVHHEYAMAFRYHTQRALMTGPDAEVYRAHLAAEAITELGHAGRLLDHLVMLGHVPDMHVAYAVSDDVGCAPCVLFRENLMHEEDGLAIYESAIILADECDRVALRVDLEDLASEEQQHIYETRRLLAEYPPPLVVRCERSGPEPSER